MGDGGGEFFPRRVAEWGAWFLGAHSGTLERSPDLGKKEGPEYQADFFVFAGRLGG